MRRYHWRMALRRVRHLCIVLAATVAVFGTIGGSAPASAAASRPKKPCDVVSLDTLKRIVGAPFTASKYSSGRECDWVGASFKDTIVFQYSKSDPGRSIPQKSKAITVAGHKAAFIRATKRRRV